MKAAANGEAYRDKPLVLNGQQTYSVLPAIEWL